MTIMIFAIAWGKAAYEAMVDGRRFPKIAAERLIEVSGRLIAGDNAPDLYERSVQ